MMKAQPIKAVGCNYSCVYQELRAFSAYTRGEKSKISVLVPTLNPKSQNRRKEKAAEINEREK